MPPVNYVGTSLYSFPFNTDSNKGLFIPFPNREIKDPLTSICATQGSGTPAQKLDVFPLGTQVIRSPSCQMAGTNYNSVVYLHVEPYLAQCMLGTGLQAGLHPCLTVQS